MAVYALTSFSGAPGVTTTAIAWTYLSPRPTLLLEADPTGGSPVLAGPFRAELFHDTSVLDLISYAGGGAGEPGFAGGDAALVQALWNHAIALPETSDRRALPTVAAHHQARSMNATWPAVARAARQLSETAGTDVVIDAGRRSLEHSPLPLLTGADLVICLTDSTLTALNATRWGLDALRDELSYAGDPDRVVVVPVRPDTGSIRSLLRGRREPAATARPWSVGEIRQLVNPTVVLDQLPFDRMNAQVFSHGTLGDRHSSSSAYTAAITQLIDAATGHLNQLRSDPELDTETEARS